MKNVVRNLLIVCFSFFVLSCNQAQNWPGWRGENRDGKVKDFETPNPWPDELSRVWQKEVGLGDASVSLVNGKLYLCVKQESDEVALCLDERTGDQIWRTVLNPAPEVTGGASTHPGPRSTPMVANGKAYTIGAGGFINCLDAKTGAIIWKNESFTEVPEFFVGMSPLVTDNKCIAHLGGHDHGVVVAFNADNGDIIWELEGEPSTYSSPVTMTVGGQQVIVIQTETDLIGVSKDGKLLWKIPTPGEQRFYNSTTPVIDGDNVIVCGQGVGTKSFKIEKSGDNFTYKENWHNPDLGGSFNTPVLKDGYLYGNEARFGRLYCLNASTGATCWNDSVNHNRFASTLDLGDFMLSLSATGNIIIFKPDPEKYVEIAVYKVADTEVYAYPLVTGDKIYIKDKEMLTCWSVK